MSKLAVTIKPVGCEYNRFNLNPGEVMEYERKDGSLGLILACPQCGYPGSGPHIWNPITQTLTPSLICGNEGCGYHGHLTHGYFDKINRRAFAYGENNAYLIIFCPGCGEIHAVRVQDTDGGLKVHDWDGDIMNPTIRPSIGISKNLEGKFVCHCYVTKGKIRFLKDCIHDLAEQVVELPEVPMILIPRKTLSQN